MPAATRRAFSDPAEFQDAIPSSDVRIIVTKPGPFRADLTAIQLHRLSLLEGSTSLPLVARASEIAGRSTIMFPTNARQNPLHAGGKGLLPGSIGQPSLGAENYLRTSGECRFGVMHLPTEALSAASLTLCGRDLSAPAMTRLVTPCAEAMKRRMRLRSAISRFAFAAPDTDARPEVAKAIEHALIETMVACLYASDAEPVNDNPRHDAVMRRFERALDAHEGEPLYLLDSMLGNRYFGQGSSPLLRGTYWHGSATLSLAPANALGAPCAGAC